MSQITKARRDDDEVLIRCFRAGELSARRYTAGELAAERARARKKTERHLRRLCLGKRPWHWSARRRDLRAAVVETREWLLTIALHESTDGARIEDLRDTLAAFTRFVDCLDGASRAVCRAFGQDLVLHVAAGVSEAQQHTPEVVAARGRIGDDIRAVARFYDSGS